MKTNNRNTYSFLSALFASFFLIFSGTTGVSAWRNVEAIMLLVTQTPFIKLAFTIILILASLGGITVLIGGILILQQKNLFGRILILIGAGAGIITLIAKVIIALTNKEFAFAALFSSGTIGVLFAALANRLAKPKPIGRKYMRRLRQKF